MVPKMGTKKRSKSGTKREQTRNQKRSKNWNQGGVDQEPKNEANLEPRGSRLGTKKGAEIGTEKTEVFRFVLLWSSALCSQLLLQGVHRMAPMQQVVSPLALLSQQENHLQIVSGCLFSFEESKQIQTVKEKPESAVFGTKNGAKTRT